MGAENDINRREFLKSLGVGAAAWLAASRTGDAWGAEGAAGRPNVIFILTDDQGYGELSCHGNPIIRTPNIDRLWAESTRFTCFQVAPTCSPTRSQLMTGFHEFRVGVTDTKGGREQLNLKATTLAQVLSAAGYATGIFGKWHLGDPSEYRPDHRGFQEALTHGSGGLGQVNLGDHPDNAVTPYFDPTLYHNGEFVVEKGYCTDVFFTRAIEWIEKQKDRPFFCYIPTNTPHAPTDVPERYAEPYKDKGLIDGGDKYYGMIANIDKNIGKLLARVHELGLDENTIVVFMTDNGHAIGGAPGAGHDKEGWPSKPGALYNAGMRGGKGQPWEGGPRVPCFFRRPGKFKAGLDIDRLAGAIDFMPTIAELCGARAPEGIDGRSLAPLLRDPKADWPDRFLVVHVGRWPKGQADEFKYKNYAIRSQQYRFVNNAELHDMVADPGEKTDVLDQHPEVVEKMRAFYEKWWADTRPRMINE